VLERRVVLSATIDIRLRKVAWRYSRRGVGLKQREETVWQDESVDAATRHPIFIKNA